MCGIVGVAGPLVLKDEATMKRLLLLDYFRGPDSTGMAQIKNGKDIEVCKIASNPIDLFGMAKFKTMLSGSASKAWIGHNRAATRGQVTSANAHPYHFGKIVGVHNGTLEYMSQKDLEKAAGEEFATDSAAIFACIDRIGIEATVPLLRGAWSLVWYDQEEDSLNFLRNKERPMWYSWDKDMNRLFWASEWEMIDAAVKMSTQGYDLHEITEDGKTYKFFGTTVDLHYKYNLSELGKHGKKELYLGERVERKGKEPTPVTSYQGVARTDPFIPKAGGSHGTHGTGSTSSGTALTTTSTGSQGNSGGHTHKKEPKVVQLFGDAKSPLAGVVDEDRFRELAKYGCSWCGADVDFNEVGVTIIDRDDIIICPTCSGYPGSDSRVYLPDIAGLT